VSESRFIYTWTPVHKWTSFRKMAVDIHFWRSKLLDLAEEPQTHIASLYQIFRQISFEDRSRTSMEVWRLIQSIIAHDSYRVHFRCPIKPPGSFPARSQISMIQASLDPEGHVDRRRRRSHQTRFCRCRSSMNRSSYSRPEHRHGIFVHQYRKAQRMTAANGTTTYSQSAINLINRYKETYQADQTHTQPHILDPRRTTSRSRHRHSCRRSRS